MESMLSGKSLVLARSNEGNKSLIENEVNGLLFDDPVQFK